MHFYVTGYKFGMMVWYGYKFGMILISLSFSRCVNFVGRGLGLGLEPSGLERFGLDNNTDTH